MTVEVLNVSAVDFTWFLAEAISARSASSCFTTSNSPLKRWSFSMSILYVSILSMSRLRPGTVLIRPLKLLPTWVSLGILDITALNCH